MSGSPTWAEIRLREEQERKLREERQRRAEEERRRREEAERLAREALRVSLVGEIGREVARARQLIAELRSAPTSAQVPGGIPHLEPQLDALVAQQFTLDSAVPALEQVKGATRQLQRIHASVQQVQREVQARQGALREEVASEQARERTNQLAQAESVAAAEVERRRREAELASSQRQAMVAGARAKLQVRLAGLAADDVVVTWCSGDIAEVRADVDALDAVADPDSESSRLHARLDAVLERAQARQLIEERRAHIVNALQDGLRAQGFQVGDAQLVGASLEGEVVFRAARPDRRYVDVSVPIEGRVVYEVDGSDRIEERAPDGNAYTSCDETEARLESLHADINARFGIEAGELLWEQKDPLRKNKTANELPGGSPGRATSVK